MIVKITKEPDGRDSILMTSENEEERLALRRLETNRENLKFNIGVYIDQSVEILLG